MNIALDLDGTLISCEPRQTAVLQAALTNVRVQIDRSAIWPLKRNGASTEAALSELGVAPALAREVSLEWQRMVEQPAWLALDSVLPGVIEVLQMMRAAGARLWLLTARNRPEWVRQQLIQLGLAPLLDKVVVVPSNQASSAKAAVLREALAVAFFGDTESDWRAAVAAQVPFYALETGQRSAAFLATTDIKPVHADLMAAWNAFKAA
ncbi:MAG: hypothetical protein RLY20_2246 [Verrucomicrobiota bacterium]|jgi:phosphoglycolate phosphatase-like HAD superfamily hydrolase